MSSSKLVDYRQFYHGSEIFGKHGFNIDDTVYRSQC